MTDGRQIVAPGNKLDISTVGASEERIVCKKQRYVGKGSPDKEFHLKPLLEMTSYLFIDGINQGPWTGYVFPAKYKEKTGILSSRQQQVELVSFSQEVTTVAAGITVAVKISENSNGLVDLDGTINLDIKFGDAAPNKITNLLNSGCSKTISVISNPGEECEYISAKALQDLISVHIQDASRSVLSPNPYIYSNIEKIESELRAKLRDDVYLAERGLYVTNVDIRIDTTPLEDIETAEAKAKINQRYRQLELEDKKNEVKFNEELKELEKKKEE